MSAGAGGSPDGGRSGGSPDANGASGGNGSGPLGLGGEIRCGMDMVSLERVARLSRELHPEDLARLFGEGELAACRAGRFTERLLAERFAAKEACLKLFPLETANGELCVEDIAVRGNGERAYRVEPGAKLRQAMDKQGVEGIQISMASCRTQAFAIAVATSTNGNGNPAREATSPRLAAEAVRRLEPSLLGRMIYRFFPVRRRVVLSNMRRVFGHHLERPEYHRLAQAFYSHMSLFVLETIAYTLKPLRRIAEEVRVENMEIPLRAAEEGRGLIILTGHFGNWEIASAAGSLRFPQYQGKFHFLRRPISTRWIEGLVLRRFRRAGLKVIPKKGSLLQILDLLGRNEALVFIMDQHASVPKDGIPVEFFGEEAGTFRSLALIAKASNAPVIPAHSYREATGRHVLRFEKPLGWIDHDDPAEETRLNTRAYNAALERMVLRHPEQWFWMHKRWKLSAKRGKR
jgi:holo-[acyl-carrier-protein] synthase